MTYQPPRYRKRNAPAPPPAAEKRRAHWVELLFLILGASVAFYLLVVLFKLKGG